MDKQSKESIFAGRFWRSKYLFRDFPGGPQNFWNLERVFPSKREKELLFLPSNDICCKSTGWPRPCPVHPALQVVGGPCHEVHRLYLQPQSDLVVLWLFEWWMMTKLLEYWRKVMVMVEGSDIILKNAMYNWLNRLCLLYGKSHSMTKPMDVTFCNLPGFCQSTLAKAIQWQIPDTLTFAM